MQEQNNDLNSEKEILKDLLLKEEDVLLKLKDLVNISKKYFMIEQNTGNIIFSKTAKLGNREKIELLLIGRYFASRLKVINKEQLNISELSTLLGIQNTSLSKPLGILISDGYVNKNNNSEYSIVFHKIEEILQYLK
jgi:hypothetical protein